MAKRTLQKKLFRDMSRSAMQFISIVLLCALGTFTFAGLDGVANLAQNTIDVYFAENRLADFWVNVPSVSRETLAKVRSIHGVAEVRARSGIKLDTTLPDEPRLQVTGYDGQMTLNIPIVETGEMLDTNDLRGCLMQAGFARVHGLSVGDRVTVKMEGREYSFLIRGTVFSPEYICVTEGTYPNPKEYGYILINASAMPFLPLTEMLVGLDAGADSAAMKAAIAQALPGALVLDRAVHQSTASAVSNAQMFANLLLVFPVLAYAVAALIVLTTLTRMIDNQRLQLGTLKALGYSSRKIRNHYLAYAIYPSAVGSVMGICVGHLTLPRLIWALLLGQNEYPYRIYPHVSKASWGMALLTVLMSVGICWYAYQKSAKETTAELLRPKPPKAGKRVLLERISFLWRRFSFNAKMTVRNLMRNRLRTVMSFVGILCCNSLIIASFGMRDSVNALAANHFTKTLSYDIRANLSRDADEADSYQHRLMAERVECLMESSVSVNGRTALLSVVENGQQLLHLGENNEHVAILSGGIAMTKKLAQTLGVKVGETVEIRLAGEKHSLRLPVTQLVVNNIQQGIYMTQAEWEDLRKGAFKPTALLIQNPSPNLRTVLADMDEVESIDDPREQSRELTNLLELIGSVFIILMCLALALAFVICYNMGLMNFSERVREYATLKVLGYHQKEIRQLIVGENNIISILAILASIYPGLGLTGLVLLVCQSDHIIYPSNPTVLSVVIACLITYAFSLCIQLFLVRKVREIDMVEALKSVE